MKMVKMSLAGVVLLLLSCSFAPIAMSVEPCAYQPVGQLPACPDGGSCCMLYGDPNYGYCTACVGDAAGTVEAVERRPERPLAR